MTGEGAPESPVVTEPAPGVGDAAVGREGGDRVEIPDLVLRPRGVDREVFDPSKRDLEWRRSHGLEDSDVAITFLGRLVMEKGLDTFAETIVELRKIARDL